VSLINKIFKAMKKTCGFLLARNIFLMLVTVVSCRSEVEKDRDDLMDLANKNAMRLLTHPPKYNEGFSLKNSFIPGIVENQEMGELDRKHMVTFGWNDRPHRTWQQVDELIAPDLEKILGANGKYTDEEKAQTIGIQFVSLNIIRDYLLKETPSPELIERLNFYMDNLYKHKSPDLDIMTDALIYSRPYISEARYEKFREYILGVARKNLDYVRANQERFKKLYEESIGDKKLVYLREGKHLQNYTEEAAYVKARLGSVK